MREPRKFCQRGSNSDKFLFYHLVKLDPNTTKMGHHRSTSKTPFKWWADEWDDGPTLNAGLVALWFFRGSGPVLLRNHIFFRGGGEVSPDPVPPLDPPMDIFHFADNIRLENVDVVVWQASDQGMSTSDETKHIHSWILLCLWWWIWKRKRWKK